MIYKTQEDIFRYRMSYIVMPLRHAFTHVMERNKGVWRDQLFCYIGSKRAIAISPSKEYKYLDKDKIVSDMADIMRHVTVNEAIFTCCRPLELDSGPIDTFNILYFGPAAFEGRAICMPYTYLSRTNDVWVYEHELFDRVADNFNSHTLNLLRDPFYGTDDQISYEQATRNLGAKGYRIVDTDEIAKKRVGSIIATIGKTTF